MPKGAFILFSSSVRPSSAAADMLSSTMSPTRNTISGDKPFILSTRPLMRELFIKGPTCISETATAQSESMAGLPSGISRLRVTIRAFLAFRLPKEIKTIIRQMPTFHICACSVVPKSGRKENEDKSL